MALLPKEPAQIESQHQCGAQHGLNQRSFQGEAGLLRDFGLWGLTNRQQVTLVRHQVPAE